ncbi:MAG: hypothetical protein LBQ09_05945 [Acidobacteriaceae bacterium]|nr:hypothetical protein [Acidobacteriaceae bacterium]
MCVSLGVADLCAETIDRIMAVVSGHLILLSDVRAAETLGLVPLAPGEGAATIVERLIDRTLILDEVNRYAPPDPDDRQIADELSALRARFSSADAFTASLVRLGLDERNVRETVRQNLRARAYITQRFGAETPEQAQVAIGEWVAGLRRRAEIVVVAATAPPAP